MKKDLKRVGIYGGMDLTLVLIKDELWRLIFTPLLAVDWSVISVMYGVWKAVAIKLDTCECVTTLIHTNQKDIVYHWEYQADGCNSSYIGETSRTLGERVKEHSKSTTSAILKHCKDFHHPLPSINDFSIIDKDPSQITREAKEAIHIRRLDPNLNQNIGKMERSTSETTHKEEIARNTE